MKAIASLIWKKCCKLWVKKELWTLGLYLELPNVLINKLILLDNNYNVI